MTRGSTAACAGAPSKIFSPWSSTMTRSTTRISTPMMCSTQTMVMPMRLRMLFEHVGGALHLGRSRARRGFRRRAAAAAWWRARGRARASSARRRRARRSCAAASDGSPTMLERLLRAALRLARARCRRPRRNRRRASTFSSSESLRNGRGIWKVRRDALPADRVRRQARRSPRPRSGSSRRSGAALPAIRLNVVLLPEPFGPMRPRISPSRTSKDT